MGDGALPPTTIGAYLNDMCQSPEAILFRVAPQAGQLHVYLVYL